MQIIVIVFGWLQMLGGVAFTVFGFAAVAETGGSPVAGMSLLGIGLGIVVSGAITWCLGAAVDHLQAIRTATETQARIFSDRLQKQAM